jgi:hypothetical protein
VEGQQGKVVMDSLPVSNVLLLPVTANQAATELSSSNAYSDPNNPPLNSFDPSY